MNKSPYFKTYEEAEEWFKKNVKKKVAEWEIFNTYKGWVWEKVGEDYDSYVGESSHLGRYNR